MGDKLGKGHVLDVTILAISHTFEGYIMYCRTHGSTLFAKQRWRHTPLSWRVLLQEETSPIARE